MPSEIVLLAVNTWFGDHDPGSSETTNAGAISQYDGYVNTNTGRTWMNLDPTINALVWLPNNGVIESGTVTLIAGTANVSTANVSSTTSIDLQYNIPHGSPGAVFVSSVTSGSGFTITSTNVADTSTIYYEIQSTQFE